MIIFLKVLKCSSVGGATVSMVAFQAVDTDSTPSRLTWNFVSSYKSMARHFTNSRWRLKNKLETHRNSSVFDAGKTSSNFSDNSSFLQHYSI